jgi:hypothetical protein
MGMAYNSTVGMSTSQSSIYSTGNFPPVVERIGEGGLLGGRGQFRYMSTHSHADIEATGFFTDGKRHGMRIGDALLNLPVSTAGSSAATWHIVSASTGAIAASATAGSSAWNQAENVTVSPAST